MPARAHPQPVAGFPAAFVARVLDDALQGIGAGRSRGCYGIAGLQGSGKSTLAHQVAARAAHAGYRVAVMSLDDAYLDRPERDALARNVHPLLATRGPPGTHDVALACTVLEALRAGRSARLPRFDKATDRRMPARRWPRSGRADLVILEGWCLRVPPAPPAALIEPCNALERDEDAAGTWRRFCNDALGRHYPPLWTAIDRLLFLQPPSFDVVPGWRWEQEQALAALRPQAAAMDRARLDRFVQHFERVSRQALLALPTLADVVVPLDARRMPLSWRTASPR